MHVYNENIILTSLESLAPRICPKSVGALGLFSVRILQAYNLGLPIKNRVSSTAFGMAVVERRIVTHVRSSK